MAKRQAGSRKKTITLAEAGFDQLVGEMNRRLSTSQQDQADFLRNQTVPVHVGRGLARLNKEMASGLRGFASAATMYVEKTRRRQSGLIGPDGQKVVLGRPIDYRRINDTQRRQMLKFPPIAIGLAARIAPVVASFASWAPDCIDPIQRSVIKTVLEGKLHKLVDDSLHGAYAYGFAPFELVWKNQDLALEIVEGDDEDLVLDDPTYREFAKDGEKPPPAAPRKTVTKKPVVFPGATNLDRAKDLKPDRTDILVQGKLDEFAGLRYMSDKNQELDPLQSLVVTHAGRYGQMYGEAVLDNVYAPWYCIEIVTQLCNMYLERKGDPPYKGRAPLRAGYDSDGNIIHGYTIMTDAINSLRGPAGAVIMPSDTNAKGDWEYDLEHMAEDPRVEIFVRWIEHLIRMIFWGLLIPDGSIWQNSRVGSFAAAQTYADVAVVLREIDLRWIEGFINRYVVQRILSMNFADPKPAVITAKTRPDVKVAMLKEIILKALDLKSEFGQQLASMMDMSNALKQIGFPTI